MEDGGGGYTVVTAFYTKVDTEECMCPVDGAKVFVTRESGEQDPVDLQEDGTFSTAVFVGETVTLGLKQYTGVDDDAVSAHYFTITYDAGSSVEPNAVQPGVSPTFTYKALTNAEVHFLDTSTQTISAALVVGEDRAAASYVNGLPIVASVERCG